MIPYNNMVIQLGIYVESVHLIFKINFPATPVAS